MTTQKKKKTKKENRPMKQFCVWETGSDGSGYWLTFGSIQDAVNHDDGLPVEVFEAKLVPLGKYKSGVVKIAKDK